jgi:putative ABC transport system permease protein
MRNIFRYKQRFFMMLIGISGCTALLLTGFGIKDAMKGIVTKQYDTIEVYDLSIALSNELGESDRLSFEKETDNLLTDYIYVMEKSIDLEHDGKTRTVTFVIPEDPKDFANYVNLHDKEGNAIPFPKAGEVVITSKDAKKLGLKVGDSLTMRNSDMATIDVKVSGINENFVYGHAYLSAETYSNALGKAPVYDIVLANVLDTDKVYETAGKISDISNVQNITTVQSFKDSIGDILTSLNAIVALIISCAALLAFIVLYNLTNINITERIREIATIKVLGFYPKETAAYIFRENLLLTVISAAVGLGLGYFLDQFVIYNIDVDAITFDTQILPLSYILSILLTLLFAVIVDIILYFKLHKINMADSLKSIE